MTREHAKQLLPIITAYTEGKVIQQINHHGVFVDLNAPNWGHPANTYRIKPDPETVLMTVDDFPEGVIWLKTESTVEIVTIFHDDGKLETDKKISLIGDFHSNGVLWSTDRKNWKPLTKEVSE